MINAVIKNLLRNSILCLSTGGLLVACGGSDSQSASANKLLANGEACAEAWASATIYVGGKAASYNGVNYTAAYWTQGNNPATSSGPAGSGQPWIAGFTCGSATTTTQATTTTTKAGTTTTTKAGTTTTTKAGTTTTTKVNSTTTAATTTTTKATTTTTGVSTCPSYVAGTAYTSGQTVGNAGGYYTCDVAGWCSLGASAYEPGVGWAWTSAWHTGSASSCGGGTTTTTKATTSSTASTSSTSTTTKATTSTTACSSNCGTTTTTGPTTSTTMPPSSGYEVGSYFAQWGVYGRGFEVADMVSNGSAAKMTYVNYAFGNVYQKNGGYECGILNKLEPGATNPNAPDAGTGGDAWADFGRTAVRRVNPADVIGWEDKLAGNFRELKALKVKFPQMKVLISIGGWTWSKWFSVASATDTLRKQLVSSCIDVYIKGNLPSVDGRGGPGAAAGIFDGIDIDWEYPGVLGQPYNTVSPSDKQNYTLLMAEFRKQLDAIGGKHYYLTAAISAGAEKIDMTEPSKYSAYMDFINVMTYDFHGGWDATGTTDFQSHLYNDPASPYNGTVAGAYNGNDAIVKLLASGVPANKLTLGIPFYGRGWTGVTNANNGLYQVATGPAHGTYEAGIEDYKVLKNAAGTVYYHPITKQLWKYDGSNFWSYDDPTVIQTKINYLKSKGLRGIFSWSLDGDDPSATLMNAMGKVNN